MKRTFNHFGNALAGSVVASNVDHVHCDRGTNAKSPLGGSRYQKGDPLLFRCPLLIIFPGMEPSPLIELPAMPPIAPLADPLSVTHCRCACPV